MSIDNTHTKYLKGADKKAWEGYKSAYKAAKQADNFMKMFNLPDLKEGEEFEIPVRKPQEKKAKKKKDNNTTK